MTTNTDPRRRAKTHGVEGPRRFVEQRWLIDNIIATIGIDWDQNRTANYPAACVPEANADFQAIKARIKKLADFTPAFEAAARRREAKARAHEDAGETVSARQNYFIAAVLWSVAQWPIDVNNDHNLRLNARKRECYLAYSRLADHRVEAAWIPFQGKALPAWFHLPPGYQGGKLPAVISIPGMDGFKEIGVSMYGDRWLQRGIAVLAIEGPGQYESSVLGFDVSVPNWVEASHAIYDWMAARPELDASRIGIVGSSFGSLFGTLVAAHEPRFKACAVSATCLEPGCHTIFEEASPTYKKRFMYMAGYSDEAAFDEFAKTLTWEGHAEKIRMPYLCVAGESDELAPLEHTERLVGTLSCPKRLVVYQDSRHGIGIVPSASLGPNFAVLIADWMAARLADQPFPSERWFVTATGQVEKTPL